MHKAPPRKFQYCSRYSIKVRSVSDKTLKIQNKDAYSGTKRPNEDQIIHSIVQNLPFGDFERLALDQKCFDEMCMCCTAAKAGFILRDIQFGKSTVLSDISAGTPRPILQICLTKPVFNIHGLSHAGPRPTKPAIQQRFVWHGMKHDIRKLCKECNTCQSSKFHRHMHASLQ